MLNEIEAFARALAQATHDCAIEREQTIRQYYDADIVLPVIFGLRLRHAGGDGELICALISAGFLGRVHLLRPHALEVLSHVRLHPSRESPTEQAYYRTLATQYLEQHGVLERVHALRETLQAEADPRARVDKAIAALRESGIETFVALELARGDWRQRLLRVHDAVMRFTGDVTDVPGTLRHPALPRILDTLARHRHEKTFNNFMDAVAMTTLHELIASRQPGGEQVRFHTHSKVLMNALRESGLSHLFSYDDESGTPDPWQCRNALRGTDYCLVRASFEALHFPGIRRGAHHRPAVALDELERVADELTDALDSNEKAAVRRASRISIGGVALQTVLEDLRRFSFLDSVLSRYEVPAVETLADDLEEIFSTARSDAAHEAMHERIRADADRLMLHLSAEVETMHETVALISAVSRKLENRRAAAEYRHCHPLRDIGMAQWGLDESTLDLQLASMLLHRLLDPDAGPDVLRACADLAAAEHEASTTARCAAVCAVLHVLGLHARVAEAITRFEQHAGAIPIALHCLRLASRLLGGDRISGGEMLLQLEALELRARNEPADARGRALLGVASVLKLAARRFHDRKWLERAFHLAEFALENERRASIHAAFLAHLCLSAGIEAQLPEEALRPFVRELELSWHSEWWHFRFANTIARLVLDPLIRGDGHSPEPACELLAQASRLLQDRYPRFDDARGIELLEHVKLLQTRFDCEAAS